MREKGKEQTKGKLQRWVLNPKRRKEGEIVGNTSKH
jgi:hypothetical protein